MATIYPSRPVEEKKSHDAFYPLVSLNASYKINSMDDFRIAANLTVIELRYRSCGPTATKITISPDVCSY